jgi:3D-(3,5/4)-trihydroxycyclohexane-1,2-dione acylhydrolase (decyclizing)
MRPEQLLTALRRAMQVLTDPAECGPVTLALCQDVQAAAYEFSASFFEPKMWTNRRHRPDLNELSQAVALLKNASFSLKRWSAI